MNRWQKEYKQLCKKYAEPRIFEKNKITGDIRSFNPYESRPDNSSSWQIHSPDNETPAFMDRRYATSGSKMLFSFYMEGIHFRQFGPNMYFENTPLWYNDLTDITHNMLVTANSLGIDLYNATDHELTLIKMSLE